MTLSQPTTVERYGPRTDRAILYLPAGINSGDITVQPILDVLVRYGTPYVTGWPTSGFGESTMGEKIAWYVRTYNQITIVGASIGAEIGLHVYDEIMRLNPEANVTMIAACGIARRRDAVLPVKLLSQSCFLPIYEPRIYRIIDKHFGAEPDELLEYGIKGSAALRRHREFICNTPARTKLEQLRYLVSLDTPPVRRPRLRTIYIQAGKRGNDGQVRRSGARTFLDCTNGQLNARPELGHATFVAQPKGWSAAIDHSFSQMLGIGPI